jgi:uncharacterized protein with HEPN domain
MSRRDPAISLRQMHEHTHEVLQLMRGRIRTDLDSDRLLALALVRLLEIIGEAAGRVPADMQARRPGIPWPAIVGLRNRLIHGYDDVDHDIVWQIVTTDLPLLELELSRSFPEEKRDDRANQ